MTTRETTRPLPVGGGLRLRPLTLVLLSLLLLLAGGALLPANVVFASDGYGSGTCGAETTRTCEATDSVLGAGITALAAAIGTPDSAVPTKVVMTGYKAQAVGGAMGAVTALDAVSPKASPQGIPYAHLVSADGASSIATGVGDATAATLQSVDAGRANAATSCSSATAGDAGDAHVIAARPGRRYVSVQLQADPDGPLRVCRASTTGAGCTLTSGCGDLINAGTATTAGGFWDDSYSYSGPLAICAPSGTVAYCTSEVW